MRPPRKPNVWWKQIDDLNESFPWQGTRNRDKVINMNRLYEGGMYKKVLYLPTYYLFIPMSCNVKGQVPWNYILIHVLIDFISFHAGQQVASSVLYLGRYFKMLFFLYQIIHLCRLVGTYSVGTYTTYLTIIFEFMLKFCKMRSLVNTHLHTLQAYLLFMYFMVRRYPIHMWKYRKVDQK